MCRCGFESVTQSIRFTCHILPVVLQAVNPALPHELIQRCAWLTVEVSHYQSRHMPSHILRHCCCYQLLQVVQEQTQLRKLYVASLWVEQHVRVGNSKQLRVSHTCCIPCCCQDSPRLAPGPAAATGGGGPVSTMEIPPLMPAPGTPGGVFAVPAPSSSSFLLCPQSHARYRYRSVLVTACSIFVAAAAAALAAAASPACAAAAAAGPPAAAAAAT